MSKIETVKNKYYDPAGYGSLKNTSADAKQIDPSIEFKDVKELFNEYIEQKKNMHVFSSHRRHCNELDG